MGKEVHQNLHVRLDAELRRGLQELMDDTGATSSQAARTALALGLSRAKDVRGDVIRRAFMEGLMSAQAIVKERVSRAIHSALSEFAG